MKTSTLALALCALFLPCGAEARADKPHELVFLTWFNYMDPALVRRFENQHNARIKFVYFESDELRDDILLGTDGRGYDLICSNGRSLRSYVRRGWLAPITERDVPNKKHIEPRWLEAFPGAKDYGVPFLWGTVGIAYRKDLVETPITRWRQLLDPAPDLRGKIILVKDARDLMSMALKSLGQSVNTYDTDALDQARGLLMAQRTHVKAYSYLSLTSKSALVTGNAVAALAYSGDALTLANYNPNITYVIPEEGTSIWIDYLVLGRASKRKQLAVSFINFLNEPRHAAQLAQFLHYASPNRAAEQYLPEEFLTNPIINPDQSLFNESEFLHALPPRTQKYYNSIIPQIVRD